MSLQGLLRLTLLRMRGVRMRGCRQIFLGGGVHLDHGTTIDARAAPVRVGDNVWMGRGACVLTDPPIESRTPRSAVSTASAVTIEAGAWLGPRCRVMPGTRIGAGAVVAADALVLGDVAPRTIVAGAPARPIGWRRIGDCLEFLPDLATPDSAVAKTAPSTSP